MILLTRRFCSPDGLWRNKNIILLLIQKCNITLIHTCEKSLKSKIHRVLWTCLLDAKSPRDKRFFCLYVFLLYLNLSTLGLFSTQSCSCLWSCFLSFSLPITWTSFVWRLLPPSQTTSFRQFQCSEPTAQQRSLLLKRHILGDLIHKCWRIFQEQ